jgi:hypothetical protein
MEALEQIVDVRVGQVIESESGIVWDAKGYRLQKRGAAKA